MGGLDFLQKKGLRDGVNAAAAGLARRYFRHQAVLWRVVDWLSVVAVFAFFATKTWRRSSDPIVDFPKNLYIAWRMNEGDLLYRDISCWYGPLPHLIEALAFKLFGVGLDTLLWLNLFLLGATLLLLRAVFATISDKTTVWLVSIIFLPVFGFAQYTFAGNSNFLTPYVSQATWGFAGLLILIVGLQRDGGRFSFPWLVTAGIGSAVAFLCKPEFVISAGGCWLLCLSSWALDSRKSDRFFQGMARCVGFGCVGFFAVWITVFLVFSALGGWVYAFQAVNWVPFTVFGFSFRQTWSNSKFITEAAGLDNPVARLLEHLKWSALLGAGYCGLRLGSYTWERQKHRQPLRWISVVAVILGALAAGVMINWGQSGRAVNIPSLVIAMVLFGICIHAAWFRRKSLHEFISLNLVALAGALMLIRMILNGRIQHYGFFMMPLAMCFLISLMMRGNWLVRLSVCIVTLTACARLACITLSFAQAKSLVVGDGRDQLYAFPPRLLASGVILSEALGQLPRVAPHARNLVAIPDSSAFNYYVRLKNPLIAQEWNPDNLGFLGPDRVLNDLQTKWPDVIFFFPRNLEQYGVPHFGYDERSGKSIVEWILANYSLIYWEGISSDSPTGWGISIYIPKSTAARGNTQRP